MFAMRGYLRTEETYLGGSQHGNAPPGFFPCLREKKKRIEELVCMRTTDEEDRTFARNIESTTGTVMG